MWSPVTSSGIRILRYCCVSLPPVSVTSSSSSSSLLHSFRALAFMDKATSANNQSSSFSAFSHSSRSGGRGRGLETRDNRERSRGGRGSGGGGGGGGKDKIDALGRLLYEFVASFFECFNLFNQ